MSPAAVPLLRIPVGVVIERRKADSPWIEFVWRGVGVLPGEPEMAPWTVLREQDEATLYYSGRAQALAKAVGIEETGCRQISSSPMTEGSNAWRNTSPPATAEA